MLKSGTNCIRIWSGMTGPQRPGDQTIRVDPGERTILGHLVDEPVPGQWVTWYHLCIHAMIL
jgi:hypothetical protein